MLIIVDTSVFHKVFNSQSLHFPEYKSVNRCITQCKGVMIYGGKTFLKEYKDFLRDRDGNKYNRLFIELRNTKKLIELPKDKVNEVEAELYLIEEKKKNGFNDAHLIACCRVGKCKLICTDDSTSDTYIRDIRFYPKSTMRPSIYRNAKHKHLLNDCWP